jgi:hypothetical protein
MDSSSSSLDPKIPFKTADGWLLLSVWMAGGVDEPVSLQKVIGMGDGINKAIFTNGELRNGFSRLTTAGYVVDRAGLFSVAGDALVFMKEMENTKGKNLAPLSWWEEIDRFLGVAPGSSLDLKEDKEWTYPSLSDEVIAKANKDYTRDFWKAHRESEDKKRSPLSRAYFKDKKDVKKIAELIQQGLDVNVRDADEKTVLMHAVFDANKPMVEYLLANGADVNLVDSYGETALHHATWKNSEEVVKLLLTRKPQMDPRNSCGGTPLWKAVKFSKGKGEIIELLLANGADRNMENNDGVSPFDLARSIKEFNLLQFFK